ncbi:hypothetical protein, partial [Tritonibacter sp. SIMBA_163]|uniref:hypothetical protein n=1 Tax=Tritonibacter sp. SIMBA_163 TaxID=3080868 RepID=UPI00397EACFD
MAITREDVAIYALVRSEARLVVVSIIHTEIQASDYSPRIKFLDFAELNELEPWIAIRVSRPQLDSPCAVAPLIVDIANLVMLQHPHCLFECMRCHFESRYHVLCGQLLNTALLRKSGFELASPFPRRTYPTGSV